MSFLSANNSSSVNSKMYEFPLDGHKWILYCQTILLLFTSLFGIIFNSCFFQILVKISIIHPTMKSLILSMTLAVILQCCYFVGQCVHNFLFLSQKQMFDDTSCKIFQLFHRCSSSVVIFTMLAIGFDQLWATCRLEMGKLRQTEKINKKMFIMNFSIWIIGIGQNLSSVFYLSNYSSVLPYCHYSLVSRSFDQLILSFFLICMESIVFVLYFIVYSKTKNHYDDFGSNTAQHSLAERFQLSQTLKSTVVLVKWSICQVLLYLVCFSTRIVNVVLISNSNAFEETVVYLIMFNCQLYCIFNIVHPFFLSHLNPTTLNAFVECFKIVRLFCCRVDEVKNQPAMPLSKNVVDYRKSPETNIEIIEQFWNKARLAPNK